MLAAIWMSVSLGFLPAFGFGTLRNGKAFSRSGADEEEIRKFILHNWSYGISLI